MDIAKLPHSACSLKDAPHCINRHSFISAATASVVAAGLLSVAGCEQQTNEATKQSKESTDTSRIADQATIDAAKKDGSLVIYASCEEQHVQACAEKFKELSLIHI